MKSMVLGLAAASVLGLASAAHALTYNETFLLTGAAEVPPVATPGFGAANVNLTLDTGTHVLSWSVISAGLTGPVTSAGFFGPASPTSTGPLQINLASFSLLGPSMSGSTTVSAAAEQDILAGLWYLNVGTAANPTGEIRGQLPAFSTPPTVVPEPAAMSLLGLGVLALGLRLRKR